MQDIIVFIQQHTLLIALFAVVLIILVILEFIKLKQSANRLSCTQATRLINHEKGIFVDVRPTEAYLAGHITSAISLPFAELTQKIKKIEKFRAQPLVLVCAAGTDSARAATTLTHQGFKVHILSGGIRAWREAQLPLVKG